MQSSSFIVIVLLLVSQIAQCAPTIVGRELTEPDTAGDSTEDDYYEYKYIVAEGFQKALTECRERFKWDRWNCPKKPFEDILKSLSKTLPSNKEMAYTRAVIAAYTVFSFTRSCSYGTSDLCGCSQTNAPNYFNQISTNSSNEQSSTTHLQTTEHDNQFTTEQQDPTKAQRFVWRGCDEIVKLGSKVSKYFLDVLDKDRDEDKDKYKDKDLDKASRRINEHNYRVGRLAVKKSMKRRCSCHGVSGSCQIKSCWTSTPDMAKVGEYLKRRYKVAAKVGATSAKETNIVSLNKELSTDKLAEMLVFVDASPDYCYENASLGINGTLGRYCSRAKHLGDGSEVGRDEKDSCDRLCTRCGYKIKREKINVEKQCDCRFVYCCSVECKRCPHTEDTFRCVRHS